MTTYTVFREGAPMGRGLTAEEAMSMLLTYDGYRYEIRKTEFHGKPCWDLWHSDGSENSTRGASHFTKTVVFSLEEDEQAATREIAEQVIKAGWARLPECITDEAFDTMIVDLAKEEFVLCRSDAGDGGWSLHRPDATDEEIANGNAPPLLTGHAILDPQTNAFDRPNRADYLEAYAKLQEAVG